MRETEELALQECPLCRGAGSIEEEGGWCVYVQCLDCGAHTAALAFDSEAERQEMRRRAVLSWNLGKVLHPGPGE